MRAPHGVVVRDEVTRHDEPGSVDRLLVSLDTYHDRRTAYTFVVTAGGATAEYYHSDDQEPLRDYSADELAIDGRLSWIKVEPTALYRALRVDAGVVSEWNHALVRTSSIATLVGSMTLPGYWVAACTTTAELPATSTTITRGGPNVASPLEIGTVVSLRNDPSSRLGWDATVAASRDAIGGSSYRLEAGARAAMGQQWRGDVLAGVTWLREPRQYVAIGVMFRPPISPTHHSV